MKSPLLGMRVTMIVLVAVLSTGCDIWSKRVKVGQEFMLRPKEKVVVAGSRLGLRLEGVGHSWYVDHRADSVFAMLVITGHGEPLSSSLDVGHSKTVEGYEITVKEAEESSGVGGPNCKLVVTRGR